ncbi:MULTISPECIES: hypothetical protein [unclassified Streptomyces]|uniref:hypothetical protein n=1 Tax=unclassified Streptomyces TaxID=2593676 RepID=UPI003D7535DD
MNVLHLLVTLCLTGAAALIAAGSHWIRDRSRERLYRSVARSLPHGGSVTEQQPDGSAWELRVPPGGDGR